MAAFSGTSLPPVVRLGDSADAAYSVESGTSVAWLPKQFALHLHIPVTKPVVETVKVPQAQLSLRRHSKRKRRHR